MIQAIDENFNLHASKIPELTAGMNVFRTANLTYIDAGLSCDTFNIIHITNGSQISAKEVSDTIKYFKDRKLAFCIWVNEQQLTHKLKSIFNQLGLKEQNREPGMLLNLDDYPITEHQLHQQIQIADTAERISHFAQVIAENWTPTDENVIAYYKRTSGHYLENLPGIHLVIFYEDEKPVSVVEMFSSGQGIIGLYALATLENYRGKGIGSALMSFALNKARLLGYKKVILQASEDGIGIYQKLGFEIKTVYYEFA